MSELLKAFGLFYLLGLAVIGYACLLWLIRLACERKKLKKWVTNALVTCHFILGILAILVTAMLSHRLEVESTYVPTIALVLFGLAMTWVVTFALKQWYSILQNSNAVDDRESKR